MISFRSLTLMVWFGCGCGLLPPAASDDENSPRLRRGSSVRLAPGLYRFEGKGFFRRRRIQTVSGSSRRIVFIPLPWNGNLNEWAAKLKAGGDLVTETSHELTNTLDALRIKECGILGISGTGLSPLILPHVSRGSNAWR